ncbi:MAG: class II fructose-bisphosphate aldolase [Candidatus Melainabacteria bacterium]|jgi:fructose-bisphosphate aldolase class II
MPVATSEIYRKMLRTAKEKKFAYAAINVTSMETARAAIAGFAEKKSDGIIQVSTGGAEYASGTVIKDMVVGAIAIADYVHQMAEKFNIYIALHTDHCQPGKLDKFVRPLIAETKKRREKGLPNLFNSHMFDGSELSVKENMEIAKQLLKEMQGTELLLEVEAGVVGGEEDGHDTSNTPHDKLYTTPEDMVYVYDQLSTLSDCFLFAATFGNVHGVYKPGNVKLKPAILRDGQAAVAKAHKGANLNLVFHGGSGSTIEEIHKTLEYGVVKMNVDTDMQYAYTRPIADHMFKNYDGVLKVDGDVGNKKVYDPRVYGKAAEKSMIARIGVSCDELRSSGQTLFG